MSVILEKTKDFVCNLLTNKLDSKFLYHNLKHTQRVVKSTEELLNAHKLNAKDNESILLAAWLHDTGYTVGHENHEENSCRIAQEFLESHNYADTQIKKITAYIMATKRYYVPTNEYEKIIRDADCSHFSQKSYFETSDFLREELSQLEIANYSSKEWREANIKMFEKEHLFYTEYALENWQEGKKKNLKKLIKEKKIEKEIAKKEAIKVSL